MKNLTDEIKLTIELMQGDIDDGAHGELQSHLYSLLEMKRGLLGERVYTYTPAQLQVWPADADDRFDVILSTLRVNGLEPVALMPDEILVGNTIRRKSETPLSDEQLRAVDWYCAEVSADVTQLLIDREISYCIKLEFDGTYVKYATPLNSKPTKEIIRKGNEFYYC